MPDVPAGNGALFLRRDRRDGLLPSEVERVHLLKTLSRQSTLLMKLLVGPETDVGALERYWGKVGRAKDLRPLLESLKRAGQRVLSRDYYQVPNPDLTYGDLIFL